MTKKKVLFVGAFASNMKQGGTGGQIYACRSLIKSNLTEGVEWVEIDSTAPSNKNYGFLSRLWNAIRRLLKFIFTLSFNKIDTVLLFCADGFSIIEKGTMLLIARFFGKRTIIAPRSGYIINNLKSITYRSFIKFVFSRADFIVCQSDYWKKLFISSLYSSNEFESRFIVIYNWIDLENYTDVANKNLFKENPSNKEIKILYLAWVDRAKGIFDLIDAVANLKDKLTNFKVIVAGDGKDFDNAVLYVSKLNLEPYIQFLGWVNSQQKLELFSTSDIFVLPSYFEGSPNSLLEAISSGIPSISTNVGSIPEMLRNSAGNVLFIPGDVELFSKHIYDLSVNQQYRNQVASNQYMQALNNHSLNAAIEKFKLIL